MALPDGWIELYGRALAFAARAHGEQKTPHGLPYLAHVAAVAAEVLAALAVEEADGALAIPAALLHDVVEDTATPLSAIEGAFGARVAAGVAALSKDPAVPKERRLSDSLARIQRQPREIAMVKLADRCVNLGPPPGSWPAEKVAAYRDEAREILQALGRASPALSARLAARIAAYPPAE